jgi:hypothetical protein
MNDQLVALAAECRLSDRANEALRLAFGLACASRVRHLLEDPRALAGLDVLRDHLAGGADRAALSAAAAELKDVANRHRGSNSIDGSAHAAVSATYAVANALAGGALEAAGYAAYATVYAYGAYAVNDPSAFAPEHEWQIAELRRLLRRATDGGSSTP